MSLPYALLNSLKGPVTDNIYLAHLDLLIIVTFGRNVRRCFLPECFLTHLATLSVAAARKIEIRKQAQRELCRKTDNCFLLLLLTVSRMGNCEYRMGSGGSVFTD
jgi:hypothetical protein